MEKPNTVWWKMEKPNTVQRKNGKITFRSFTARSSAITTLQPIFPGTILGYLLSGQSYFSTVKYWDFFRLLGKWQKSMVDFYPTPEKVL